jgi:hypothetical protein
MVAKGVGGEKDNPTRIDRETKMANQAFSHFTFTLALQKNANQAFSHHTKNNRSSHSGITITKDVIILDEPKSLFS